MNGMKGSKMVELVPSEMVIAKMTSILPQGMGVLVGL